MRHQAYITMNQRWCLSFTTRDFSRHFSLKLQQYKLASNIPSSNPWGSMYGISTYIWLIFMVEMYVNIPVPWILRECYVQTDITKLIFQPHLPSSVQVHHLGATKNKCFTYMVVKLPNSIWKSMSNCIISPLVEGNIYLRFPLNAAIFHLVNPYMEHLGVNNMSSSTIFVVDTSNKNLNATTSQITRFKKIPSYLGLCMVGINVDKPQVKKKQEVKVQRIQAFFSGTVDGRNPAPVDNVCSLSHYLQDLCIPGGAGFLPSTVWKYHSGHGNESNLWRL